MDLFYQLWYHYWTHGKTQAVNADQFVLYKLTSTCNYNWQWDIDHEDSYEETRIFDDVREANLSTLCYPPKIKPQSIKTISTIIQGVLFCWKHSRMYHYAFIRNFPGKKFSQSIGPPIDWLRYYDSLSKINRDPTETYSFKLFFAPYLILPDRK